MANKLSGRLGSAYGALGNFILGSGDTVAGQSWPVSWVQGLRMTQRNFAKIAYNRFFTYKMTPRLFTFQLNRLDRAKIDTSVGYTEIGSGETLVWKFDFTNVLQSGETFTGNPTFIVYLYRQPIIVPSVVTGPTFSGAIASGTFSGSALKIGGKYTVACKVPLSSSRVEECLLDFACSV